MCIRDRKRRELCAQLALATQRELDGPVVGLARRRGERALERLDDVAIERLEPERSHRGGGAPIPTRLQ